MCKDTKGKIADAVEALLCTQPGGKVTVQQIMELTQMNRQSFYYHYQDINDVLQRIVVKQFCDPMKFDPQETPENWCRRGLTLVGQQKTLLRRISRELGSDRMYELAAPVLRPQVERLLPTCTGQSKVQRDMAVDSICYGVLCTITGLVQRQEPLQVEPAMEKLRAILVVFGGNA